MTDLLLEGWVSGLIELNKFEWMLGAGEAWRAPALSGLTADVGDPAAVEVFVAGVSRGTLTAPQTSIAKLAATQ